MGYGIDNASGLDLYAWAALMGLNPWHVAQLADPSGAGGLRVVSDCSTLVYERGPIAAQRVGRQEIRQAIETAERRIFEHRRIWPSPRAREATLPYPRMGDRRLTRLRDAGGDGRWIPIVLDEGEVQGLGPLTTTGATTAAVSYSDEDGDGYAETATIVATVPSGTQPGEVAVSFLAADCGPVAPAPRIAPRAVSVSGTTATITIDSWALVRPVRTSGWAIYNGTAGGLNPTVLPPDPASPLAAMVAVARERCDPTGTTQATAMALLTWETRPCPFAWCGSPNLSSTDPAATATVIARATLRDAAAGVVAVGEAVYDPTTGAWSGACGQSAIDWRRYPPDRVTIRYCAGTPLDGVRVAEPWRTTVARLAAAELTAAICGCDAAQREIARWQFDLSRTAGTSDAFAAPPDLGNPLGTRRGHIDAWRQIVDDQRLAGIIAG